MAKGRSFSRSGLRYFALWRRAMDGTTGRVETDQQAHRNPRV